MSDYWLTADDLVADTGNLAAEYVDMDGDLSDEIQQAYWDAKHSGPLTRCCM